MRLSAGTVAHAAAGNSGVAQVVKSTYGAIGYLDYFTAKAAGLTVASIENKADYFDAPSSVTAAAAMAVTRPPT